MKLFSIPNNIPNSIYLLLPILISSLNVQSVAISSTTSIWFPDKSACPLACPSLSSCPSTASCRGNIIEDECKCCKTCDAKLGEKCGKRTGICGEGLHCSLEEVGAHVGFCKETYPEKCLNVKCPVKFISACPSDSKQSIAEVVPGECCTPLPTCICDPIQCQNNVPKCKSTLERILLKSGNLSSPGNCCDTFTCQEIQTSCQNVKCPKVFDMDAQYTCPEDSFRPASYVPENSCCPINPGCRCRESICQPAFCGESETLVILSKSDGSPGKCCDKFICTNTTISGYESKDFKIIKAKKAECVDNGNIYQEGTQFLKTSCNVCVCRNGVIKCKHMDCEKPPHGCGWVGVPDTECCPVCLGCKTENSTYYNKNESWKRDDCTSCSCGDDGKSYCQTTTCMKTCENPRIEKGVCCPVCDEPTIISPPKNCPQLDCSLRCKQGLVKDTWGCYKCQCAESKAPFTNTYMYSDTDFGLLSSFESCQDFDGLTCDKQCAHGYVRNTKKCRTCKCEKCPELDQCFKQCLYGFEVNSQGCKICKCKTRELGDLSTSPSLTPSNSSCVIVADDSSLEIKDNGELWTDSNCRNCFCHYGVEFCSIITCPQKPASCDVWVKERGSCCPSCHGKESNESKHDLTVCYNPGTGRLYVDGETWYSTKLCTACTCRVGHVLCAPNDCPPVACENPVVDEMNNCCMRCPKENETNNSITHHQTLTVIANNQNGMYSPETLPAEFCVDEGRMAHLIGQTWKKDECTSCECSSDATIKCFKETCPKLSECKGKPLVVKGRCCEICSDIFSSEAICTYKKTPYKVNEEWKDGACTNCSCLQGSRTECLSLKCPACRDPIYVDNQCCPICREDSTSSDTYQHKYSNGLSTIVIIVTITVCLLLLGMTAFVGLMLYKKRNHATIKETLKTVHGANPQPHAYKPDRSSSIDDQTTESLLSDDGASTFGGNSSSRCSYERGHVFTDTLPLQAP